MLWAEWMYPKPEMITDGALWKLYFLTNKNLAPQQIELSLEPFKEAFNRIV